ncbi:MAG: glycosyltransferase, partial [Verrucomicrobiia bacterium]
MNLEAIKPTTQKRPLVSIVIPMLNERDGLRPLFDHIAQIINDTPVEWELVIVDDGSTDGTR